LIVPDPTDPVQVIGFRIVIIALDVLAGFVVLLAARPSQTHGKSRWTCCRSFSRFTQSISAPR
jgi:hypothetical protein